MAMTYFADPKLNRHQFTLFSPTLDDMLPDDHAARILDDLVNALDLSEFEKHYHGSRGQPPIPPSVLIKVLLYAMSRRIRSSRMIEYALGYHVDFMWLAQVEQIDHSTLCEFRKNHFAALKSLFRQLGKLALTMGVVRLNEITFDGTRVRANNNRNATLTAAGIEKRLDELAVELGEWAKEIEQNDQAEQSQPKAELPPELRDTKGRQKQLQESLKKVQQMDEDRRKNKQINPKENPAQIPTTDPDSRIMPNKEGGYAANFTPLAAVATHGDFILATDVIDSAVEHTELQTAVDQIEQDFGERPEAVMADGHFATAANIVAFEGTGTELISPLAVTSPAASNPAIRPDPTVAVPEQEWSQLPDNPCTKKLDKSCFVYDKETDTYYCPMGKPLPNDERKYKNTASGKNYFNVYRCADCSDCPLKARCVSPKSKDGRSVSRDEHTEDRERHAAKMATPEKKEQYKRRLHGGEVAFAYIKQVLGVRQFLLRGIEKVKTEWLWACTTYNITKLIRQVAKLRKQFDQQQAAEVS